MNDIKLNSLVKIVILIAISTLIIACNSIPHSKQYLIQKNYLIQAGLNGTTNILDIKGNENFKNIHSGTPNKPEVEGYMTFDTRGNLVAIKKEKGENVTLILVEFKYDKSGKLRWIIPSNEYFKTLDYDSLRIEYRGITPKREVAVKSGVDIWIEDITFDDKNHTYLFSKTMNNNKKLFDLYCFEGDKILAEYHKNRLSDNKIDSTKYYYRKNKLYRKSSMFNASVVSVVNYDNLERPKKAVTMFYKKDSIAWVDNYYYLVDDRLPHSIITISPLGWRDEKNYYWDK